jgi:antitoxin HigA-1
MTIGHPWTAPLSKVPSTNSLQHLPLPMTPARRLYQGPLFPQSAVASAGALSLALQRGDVGSAAELAQLIHVPANRVSHILSGKRHITADTALRLGRWFGTGPYLWLNLQQAYDLDLARQQLGAALEGIEPRLPVAVNAMGVEDMAKPDDP